MDEILTKEPSPHLDPCPFCGGGRTEIHPNGRVWAGMKWGEPTSVSIRHWCEPVPGQPSRMIERIGRDLDSAVQAWNQRAQPQDVLLRRIAELEAENFALAAGLCIHPGTGLTGDDHGNTYCQFERKVVQLEKKDWKKVNKR